MSIEIVGILVFLIYALIGLGFISLIIYLIIRRINLKEKEDFEKRDN